MQQAIDEDGYIWNVDAQGNPVGDRPVGRANPQQAAPAPAGPRPFTVGTPRAPEQKAPYRWQANDGSLMEVGPDGNPRVVYQDEPKPNSRDGKSLRQGDGVKLSALIDSYAGLKNAAIGFENDFAGNTIGGEMENWAQGLLGTGTPGQRDWWSAFRATDNLIRNDLFGASLTDGEKRAYEQTTVSPSMTPDVVRQNLQRRVEIARKGLERQIDRYRAAGFNEKEIEALAGEYAPDFGVGKPWNEQAPKFELPRAAGAKEAAPLEVDGATSKGGLQEIPQLRGIENTVIDMIGKGASKGQIIDFLDEKLAPYNARVGNNLMGYLGDIVRKHKANPRQPVRSLGTGWEMLYHKELPDNGENNTFLGIDPDSTGGNIVMNTANSVTAGLPAYLAGKQDVLEQANAERPKSAFTGKFAGNLAALTGINAGAKLIGGPVGAALTKGGGVGGDMLYGGVQGGFEGGPTGIVTGAVTAGLGNKVGGAIASGTGRVIRGVTDPAVKRLSAQGVPMTMGMIAGRNNALGNVMNLLESAPGIRGMMARRYQDAEEGVYRAALRDSVEGVGGSIKDVGPEGLSQAYDATDAAYRDALGGRQFNGRDPQFLDEMGAAIQAGEQIPELGPQFSHAIRKDIKPLFDADGMLTGERLQDSLQFLRNRRASYGQHPLGSDIGEAFLGVEDAIKGMAGRQIPEVVPKLDAANAAYRKVNVLADAAKTAVNRGGNPTPAQINRASVNSTNKFLGKRAAVTGGRPFAQLGDDAERIIPSKVGDSGTASRVAALAAPGILGGAAYGSNEAGAGPAVYVPLAMLAALTSKTGSKVAQKLLTGDRPEAIAKIGNALVKHKRKAGLFGAAAASAVPPQLSQ